MLFVSSIAHNEDFIDAKNEKNDEFRKIHFSKVWDVKLGLTVQKGPENLN